MLERHLHLYVTQIPPAITWLPNSVMQLQDQIVDYKCSLLQHKKKLHATSAASESQLKARNVRCSSVCMKLWQGHGRGSAAHERVYTYR